MNIDKYIKEEFENRTETETKSRRVKFGKFKIL